MAIVTRGSELGKALCTVLGLDTSVVARLEIDINRSDVATIKATTFILNDQVEEIVRVFKMAEWREEVI